MERPAPAADGARRSRDVERPSTGPRRDIQGLRALAVLAVIANHLFEWPSGGFVGVDVFFVVSGFVITRGLVRQYELEGTVSARGFYRRRVKRIIPAATLVLFVTVAASFVLLPAARAWSIFWDAVAAFFFASNWRYAEQGTDYFANGLLPSPLQHYWSLSIEEQFYFVWPWLMLAVLLAGTRLFALKREHGRLVAGVLMGVIIAASFGWAMYQTTTHAEYAYFSTLARVWELGLGALLAIAEPRLRIRQLGLRSALAWAGLVAVVASLFVVSATEGFPAPWAAFPVFATALVIAAGCGGDVRLFPMTNDKAQYVGDISYSLYLWHFPVIVLLASVIETETLAYYATAVFLIAALSVASFHLVEDPLRKANWIERGSGRRIYFPEGWKYAALVLVLVPVIALSAYTVMPGRIGSAASSAPIAAFEGGLSIPEQKADEFKCVGAAAMVEGNDCPLNTGPGTTPSVGNLDISLGAFDCWLESDTPFKVCHFGSDRPDATKIALVGDSHAVLLIPALKDWLIDKNWSVDSFGGENCQWQAEGAGSQTCVAQPQIQERLETGMYEAIVTTTGRDRYPADYDVDAAIETYRELWQPVEQTGTKIIVFADIPLPSEESLLCVQRVGFRPDTDHCGTPEDEAYAKRDLPVLVAPHVPHTTVIDMHDFFCVDGECPSVIGNVIVYRDIVGHMTEPYAATLGQFLVPQIERALRG